MVGGWNEGQDQHATPQGWSGFDYVSVGGSIAEAQRSQVHAKDVTAVRVRDRGGLRTADHR